MSDSGKRVCPVGLAGHLDNRFRRWIQNPEKILKPYIEEGMTVLDVGCGPGFFSIDMAKIVGKSGRVIAADLQEGMLEKLRNKIKGTELEKRITLHQCDRDRIDLSERVDFVLLFYMVHEVPDVEGLFSEIETILKPKGLVLVVEPPFHVSKKAFENMVKKASDTGLSVVERPHILLSKAVVLKKG
jgi:ubiquinone/menaquinone biosynthesis C-methylase UbiE